MTVSLRPIDPASAEAIAAGRTPDGIRVVPGYPTEFSADVAGFVGSDGQVGPFFVERSEDGSVVGEIGGAFVADGTVEVGYAIVSSSWNRGYATAAVAAFVDAARAAADIDRLVAHTPVDRPQSGRVLEKAGFTAAGETEDQLDGTPVRVIRWELAV